jgi:hypothetical protein
LTIIVTDGWIRTPISQDRRPLLGSFTDPDTLL